MNEVSELIGVIRRENGRYYVQDLFSQQKSELMLGTENSIHYVTGCIIKGHIKHDKVMPQFLLATANSMKARLYQIAANYHLKPVFSKAVMQEVAAILANPGLDDMRLVNREEHAFCTIDDAGTRDLDQALYIEQKTDMYRVYYALADASYYVRQGTRLFDEALQRGSSFYLPGLMIPMLPRELCEGLISLNENVPRRAMIFELNLDVHGVCVKTQIYRARIKSRAKLSFEQVQTFLDGENSVLSNDSALANSLKLLQIVGELRLKLAEERNIVRYRRHDINVKLGEDGCRFTILDDLRNDVEQYNEQLSLLCNVEGARFLRQGDTEDDPIHPVYRIHPSPPQSQMVTFEKLIQQLIKVQQLDAQMWVWRKDGDLSLAKYLKNLPTTGPLSAISQAIHRQAIMINVRSTFAAEAASHYGVGVDVYARFSAPMREMVGIFLHNETIKKLSKSVPIVSKQEAESLRDQVIKKANQVKLVQKKITHQSNLLVLDQIFNDDLKDKGRNRSLHQGVVVGLDKRKIYVLLDKPKIDVKVYVEHLEEILNLSFQVKNDVVLYQQPGNVIFIRLGDAVRLSVVKREQSRDRWVLMVSRIDKKV